MQANVPLAITSTTLGAAVLVSLACVGCNNPASDALASALKPLTSKYTIGGSVSGLSGNGLVLEDNGTDDLTVPVDGTFTFATALALGASYLMSQLIKPLALSISIIGLGTCLAGCASSRGYDTAFSEKQSIAGNSHTFQAAKDPTFRAVTGTLVQKGFNIDQTDEAMGIIKATRSYQDPKDAETNYHITATAYVNASSDGGTIVTLSASQQTLLYRHGHSWTLLPLLPIIPIPTGRKFETVTTGEGGITAGSFYTDFFAAVEHTLASTAPAPAGTAPAPAARVAAERPGSVSTSSSAPATDK